jgi:inosine/xanthosine triphosphatase
MKILLGSTKQMKIEAVLGVLQDLQRRSLIPELPKVAGVEVESGVPITPFENETYKGAYNRAESLYKRHKSEADLFAGLESGLIDREGTKFEECWCVIFDTTGRIFKGISSALALPEAVVTRMNNGEKHSDILDDIAAKLKANPKDTWGLYSRQAVTRSDSLREAFRNAYVSYISS